MTTEPVIWKFALEWPESGSYFSAEMPRGARPLSVGYAGDPAPGRGAFTVWAIVPDRTAPKVRRVFWVAGTGHDLPPPILDRRCLGRVEIQGGALIFHVFDIGEAVPS